VRRRGRNPHPQRLPHRRRRLGPRRRLPLPGQQADPVRFERHPVSDGEHLTIDSLDITVLATPGHTDTHLAYLIGDTDHPNGAALFSGGSLLYGTVGRTDLLGPDRTEGLTRAQYRSAHRLAALPSHTRLFPTHGFGSFCSTGPTVNVDVATIGDEITRNDALTAINEASFAADLLAALGPYPAYYRHMAPANLAGPTAAPLDAPPLLDLADIRAALRGPGWVVDLRDRRAHAAAHLPGAIGVELGPNMATYLGWILPWGIGLTLIADSADQLLQARRQLARIGIDDLPGAFLHDGNTIAHTVGYRVAGFAELADTLRRDTAAVLLDTRHRSEHDAERIPGALNIPLQELDHRIHEIPPGPLWVHCASGYRASIAASLLTRAGRATTLIDDTFTAAAALQLTTTATLVGGAATHTGNRHD